MSHWSKDAQKSANGSMGAEAPDAAVQGCKQQGWEPVAETSLLPGWMPELEILAEVVDPAPVATSNVNLGSLDPAVLGALADVGLTAAANMTWIELEFVGADGKGIADQKVHVELTDGSKRDEKTDTNGIVRIAGIAAGVCKVSFPDLDTEAWVKV